MVFNSLEFIIFFIIVVPLYFVMPTRYSWIILLISSYIFYMFWKPAYILLILLSTIIDYIATNLMSREEEKSKRKKYLLLSLLSNLGLLFVFKYFNFFNYSIARAINLFGYSIQPFNLNVLLPVGISFYTFQTLSYTIDVYRGKTKVEKNFGIFALYVSFFPQLVAGPIERSSHLLPQFRQKHNLNWTRIKDGLVLMLWGYFKKVVIADRVAIFVNNAYETPGNYNGWILILATVFFAFQIYCDFSGYSDIAIGAAKVLGFDLMKNFRRPYFAQSIQDFWRRWHISLSTWFKDYLYIPLGGSRVKLPRHYFNTLITFTVSGLWHGASFTFIIWGMLHGLYLIIGKVTSKYRERLMDLFKINKDSYTHKLYKIVVTFILVNIGWVFFRAGSLTNALYIFERMFSDLYILDLIGPKMTLNPLFYSLGLDELELKFACISIIGLLIIEWISGKESLIEKLKNEPLITRWVVYYTLLIIILVFGVYGNYDQSQFIYFAF